LIWFVPEKPVFVDNRVDPYPLQHITSSSTSRGTRALPPVVRQMGHPARVPAGDAVDGRGSSVGWITRFRDDRYTVPALAGAR
jgi:hypothetical protein